MKAHQDRSRRIIHLSDEVRFTLLIQVYHKKTAGVKFIFNIINNRVSIKVFGNLSSLVVVKGPCTPSSNISI